jgi:cold shock CspA family protein
MTVHSGTVVEFDDHRGVGTVEDDHGRRLFFHCTGIADGSRSIAVGAEVAFQVVAGHRGQWEATSVTKLAD